MLPFLKSKKEAGAASEPVPASVRKPDYETGYDALETCASELIDAIHEKDAAAAAVALRAAFELLESEPHMEGP